MARTKLWLERQVLVSLGLPVNSDDGALASGTGAENPLTTTEQIDRYLDEARYLVCRHLRLIPGRAEKAGQVGQMFYRLGEFTAAQAGTGTAIPSGGDNSRLWAVRAITANDAPLLFCRWEALRLYRPGYETEENAQPSYYFPTDETGEHIGIYPKPSLGVSLRASGYVIPPSIVSGSQAWDFLADEEFAPLVSYACFKIGEQAGPGLDASITQKMGLFAADWNQAAASWFARVSEPDKRDFRMVLPLLGNISGAQTGTIE